MVTLPDGVDACDIGTITIWCEPFTAFFSRLEVPTSLFVSGYRKTGGSWNRDSISLQRAVNNNC